VGVSHTTNRRRNIKTKQVKIRNANDAYGWPTEFSGETLDDAIADMQTTVRACGPEFADVVVAVDDYEIID
jgi:hypothetical protein